MIRLVDGERPQPDAETEYERATTALLHKWTQAVIRDRILRGKLPSSFMDPNAFERPRA